MIRHRVCQTDFQHAIYAILFYFFDSTLDYDRTVDHTYNFTVIATDNGQPPNNGSATVRVTVTNVNDEDPVFMQPVEHVQVSEDATTNTVVHVVQAYDPDGDDVTYSFLGELIHTSTRVTCIFLPMSFRHHFLCFISCLGLLHLKGCGRG